MKTTDLLSNFKDGNETGWSAEFEWLWRFQSAHLFKLVRDIAVNGIQNPVLLGNDGRVWDGHHRIAAAVALGLEDIPTTEAE